jgi:DNA-binding phage protein
VPKTMKDLMRAIRKEARAAGPRGIAELRAFEAYASGVSKELGQLLSARGLSQSELGRRAQIAQPEVSKILNGKSNPRIRTVERLARAMGAELRIVLSSSLRTNRSAQTHRRSRGTR